MGYITVLDVSGMEITFPTSAHILLCFPILSRIALIQYQCFGIAEQHQDYLSKFPLTKGER